MSPLTCPHCEAQNPDEAAFCEKCGKALPRAEPSSPRVVSDEETAGTTEDQIVEEDQRRKLCGQAAGALLGVAILTLAGGIFTYFVLRNAARGDPEELRGPLIVNLVLAGIFGALSFWARLRPLPAAVVGLVLFVAVQAASMILEPASIRAGLVIKLIVVALLGLAVHGGVKYKRLRLDTGAPRGDAAV